MTERAECSGPFAELLGRISDVSASEENLLALIDFILDETKSVLGDVSVELLLFHSEMNILYPHRAAGSPETWGIIDTKKGLSQKALNDLKTQYVEDVRESGFQSPFPGAMSLLSIPVIAGGRIYGVLNLGHKQPAAFPPEEITGLSIVTAYIARVLETVHLRECIFELHNQLIESLGDGMTGLEPDYSGHAERVSAYAVRIAEKLGMPGNVIENIERSGILHDIGKKGVSPVILTKPGKLTSEEFEEVKKHTVLGRFLLKPLGFMPGVLDGIASHHERWDGAGYPRGLSGKAIPIEGRILAVAEALDAMTTTQPYRDALSLPDAMKEIRDQSGKQFDPDVVTALCSVLADDQPEMHCQ